MESSKDGHDDPLVTHSNDASNAAAISDMSDLMTFVTDYNCTYVSTSNHSSSEMSAGGGAEIKGDIWLLECPNNTYPITDLPSNMAAGLPGELTFNDDSLVSVIAYSLLLCISATGNLLVFVTLFRNRHRKSRVNLFIMHLSIADMIVTFIMMPMEIGWHITVEWKAGDLACRVLMFFRAFGFYLSSSILIAISLDRFFAITQPLSLGDAGKRAKIMLILAWMFSTCASFPQVC